MGEIGWGEGEAKQLDVDAAVRVTDDDHLVDAKVAGESGWGEGEARWLDVDPAVRVTGDDSLVDAKVAGEGCHGDSTNENSYDMGVAIDGQNRAMRSQTDHEAGRGLATGTYEVGR